MGGGVNSLNYNTRIYKLVAGADIIMQRIRRGVSAVEREAQGTLLVETGRG